jgi:hypothetical protein
VVRGRNAGAMTTKTKRLRELYGVELFREAVLEMVEHGTHDLGALALLCEQGRRRRNLPVPLPLVLPSRVVDIDVVSRDLGSYDGPEAGAS